MSGDVLAQLALLDAQIVRCQLYAQLWMARAVTGAAGRRKVFKGNRQLSPDELNDEALGTALSHVERIEEMADLKHKLLQQHGGQ